MRLQKAPNGWSCLDDPGEPGTNKPRWSVNDTEGRLLSELFRGLIVLEIGTGLGMSTKRIAETAAYVHTVDIDNWVRENVAPGLPDNVMFYDSLAKVPKLLDAAFLDGLHSYDQCTQDIKDAKTIVKKGGIIVFHDVKMKAVYAAIEESKLYGVEIKTPAGMALCWND